MPFKRYGACIVAFLCVFLSRPGFCQPAFTRPNGDIAFELSVSEEFDNASKPLIVVSTSIPYRGLVFFLRGPRYEARYRVYLEIKDEHGKRVRGEVWEESVVAADFKETTSYSQMASSRKTFPIAAGEYHAAVTIEVIDTSRRFTQEEVVRVVGEGMGSLELSAPMFYTHSEDSLSPKPREGEITVAPCSPAGETHLRSNPQAIYGDFNAWARAALNVVAPGSKEPTPFALSVRVRDARGVVALYTRRLFDGIEGGHGTLCFDINIDNFILGEYQINVVAETRDGAEKSESQGRFTVLLNRGLLGPHFSDLVEILSVIAPKKDVEEIASAPPEERIEAWTNFWRKRDPRHSTESNEAFGEFLRRLREVLKSFSRVAPGWRTDMGRTYLTNGPPDKVEDKQDAQTARNYRLWYYYSKGVVYIFEDVFGMGTGDYRLLRTEML